MIKKKATWIPEEILVAVPGITLHRQLTLFASLSDCVAAWVSSMDSRPSTLVLEQHWMT